MSSVDATYLVSFYVMTFRVHVYGDFLFYYCIATFGYLSHAYATHDRRDVVTVSCMMWGKEWVERLMINVAYLAIVVTHCEVIVSRLHHDFSDAESWLKVCGKQLNRYCMSLNLPRVSAPISHLSHRRWVRNGLRIFLLHL